MTKAIGSFVSSPGHRPCELTNDPIASEAIDFKFQPDTIMLQVHNLNVGSN